MNRRDFTLSAATAAAGLALTSTAKSYARVIGANDRVNVATFGLNSRAYAHLSAFHANKDMVNLTHVADVETNIMAKFAARAEKSLGTMPACEQDFRKVLAMKDIDAITIAAPDHWHTPMAVLGMQAGKAVYVEKPCSQNIHEAELIVAAQKKYGKVVQMGNQQRSSPHSMDIIQKVQAGSLIGRVYYAKTWYTNARKGIGVGKPAAVPATLDWELWQGPAPKQAYKDNVQPYNWHWFHQWGTGESLNNGTHEVDVARWALGVALPNRVSASGGRYAYKDDWQFYDTLNTSFEYPDKLIEWECRCCNDMPIYNRERGVALHGETGTVILDRDGWEVHDLKGKMLDSFNVHKGLDKTTSNDLVGADSMTDAHFKNWLTAVKSGNQSDLHAPVAEGAVAVKMLLMTNIAYDLKRPLNVDPVTGNFLNDPQATAMRKRAYDPKFEPKLV
ncbi:MAG: Gfo/Idh/MocA family protein [Janthinobacterium lividum]